MLRIPRQNHSGVFKSKVGLSAKIPSFPTQTRAWFGLSLQSLQFARHTRSLCKAV